MDRADPGAVGPSKQDVDGSEADPVVLSDRYVVAERLGRGGMADVFAARDRVLDRRVAVKILHSSHAEDPSFVARFRREATSAAQLNHPNIVQVYDWGRHQDTFFIAMELLEGGNLDDRLKASGPLPAEEAIEIAKTVAAAIGYAHRKGTVHRDIKPGNVFIGPGGEVKVGDFGIARAFDDEERITEIGTVVGTASYLSPEQAQGGEVEPPSDLYSLGVVLFEMLTGGTPFSGSSPVAIAYKHVNEEPPRASSLNPSVSGPLDGLVARLLAKDPRDRPTTAEALETELVRIAAGEAEQAAGHNSDREDHNSNQEGRASATPLPQTAGLEPTAVMPAEARPRPYVERPEPIPEMVPDERRGPSGMFILSLAVLLTLVVAGLLLLPGLIDRVNLDGGQTDEPGVSSTTTPVATSASTETTAIDESTSTESTDTSTTTTTTAPSTTVAETTQPTTAPTTATTAATTSQESSTTGG